MKKGLSLAMDQQKTPVSRAVKVIVCTLCIAMYVVGMALMFFGKFGPGLGLWAVSTAGGAFALHFIHEREQPSGSMQEHEETNTTEE